MQLQLSPDGLRIEFEWFEQFWAFHLGKAIEIPLNHIERATTEKPITHWYTLRAPGTFLPGVIQAGTYYSQLGREFWYVTKDDHYFVLELKDDYYNRIVLTLDDHERWATQINQLTAGYRLS